MSNQSDIELFYNLGIRYQKTKELNKTRELTLSFRDKVKSLQKLKDDSYYQSVDNLEFAKKYSIIECVSGSPEYKKNGDKKLCYYGTLKDKKAIIDKIKDEDLPKEMENAKIAELNTYTPGYATIEFYTIAFANIWLNAIQKDLAFLNKPINEASVKQEMVNSLPFLNIFCTDINEGIKKDVTGVIPAIKMDAETRYKTHASSILENCITEPYGLDSLGNVCRLSEGYIDKIKIYMSEEYDVFADANKKVMNYSAFTIEDPIFDSLTTDNNGYWATRGELKISPELLKNNNAEAKEQEDEQFYEDDEILEKE